ncbi:zf-HC2 domain-containing protein [Candidatus Galacturonibacter soehngenii]|uniref:Zf-HC2 domain-containing protein n=1 Tax=Candidatus Galacturonatibacter soehngenii TaxID=2307010 RepID=A0A7V7UCR3_9FIRM|nr:zf-HC2 domain-containing protein [Candidatus Galacturonibacter soehngenii]KAB1439940.1 zf-HC2 domain-containing protein [Candidatus Galacturonibacter soehngenii]MBA4685818.1 zf-HC2 domain-containing protein [Candidatus Galacturonibacter soehngenii]
MECKEVQKLITKYIAKDMNDKELEHFLNHIENCKECYEELEINYTIYAALMQLDDNPGASYDMSAMLLEQLKASKKYIIRKKAFEQFKNALYTAAMVALIIVVIIQIRLWI